MDEKKLEIIAIAIQLFSKKGYNATSVDEIAKEAGIAKGSFYSQFNSKDELLVSIFSLILEEMKSSLTKIYSETYDHSFDKLVAFFNVSFEKMLSHQTQLMMSTIFTPAFKNKEVEDKALEIMSQTSWLMREFFIDLYGEKIEPHIGDALSIVRGLVFHYVHLVNCRCFELEQQKMATFFANVFDILINGLMERNVEPMIDMRWNGQTIAFSPLMRGQRIKDLIEQMKKKLHSKVFEEKAHYMKAVQRLAEECVLPNQEVYLIDALLGYLQNVEELQEDCRELKRLLQLSAQ